jgi:CheY-like chemotaxis protein
MARVALLCPDLLFGSKVQGALEAVGHEVTLLDAEDAARAEVWRSDVLVVDLTADDYDGAVLVDSMKMGRELEDTSTLGFYAHVDAETRRRAEAAGFDRVVPRSRMAREAASLVEAVVRT